MKTVITTVTFVILTVFSASVAAQTPDGGQPEKDNQPAEAGQPTKPQSQPLAVEKVAPYQSNAPAISLEEAMQLAGSEHPAIAQAAVDQRIATSRRKQVRANFGPTLSTDADVFVWNKEVTFSFGGGTGGAGAGQLPPPMTPYEQIIYQLFANPQPTVIRDQVTADVSVTLAEPLTPLYPIYVGVQAAKKGEKIADLGYDQARRDQVKDAIVAYYRVLQARAQRDTQAQSVQQLEVQRKRLQALVKVGSAQSSDLLRIEVALAAARQQLSSADANVELAQWALALAVGRDPGEPVDASPVDTNSLPKRRGTLQDALTRALKNRPELQQLDLRIEQARTGVTTQKADYFPNVVALAQYKHSEGSGLTGKDSAFVGAQLSWKIWEWGKTYYQVDEAEAQVVKAEAGRTLARRSIELQVKKTWLDLGTSLNAYSVAGRAVDQAKEAYRIEKVRYENGESTPSELLDAQTALTEARNNRDAAFYQALIHRAELAHATGRDIEDFVRPGDQP